MKIYISKYRATITKSRKIYPKVERKWNHIKFSIKTRQKKNVGKKLRIRAINRKQ